jgi:acetyltransferase-like isoleucine patch superfamily enzyme
MGLADWDLLHIGDDVVIGYNTHLQGHTAENMVFKFREVKIGDHCSIF